MDQIASRAHITKGLIYRYFKSKDEIVAAVVQAYADAVALRLEQLIKPGLDLAEQVRRLVHDHVRQRSDHRSASLFLEIMVEATRNPKIAATVACGRRHVRDRLIALMTASAPETLVGQEHAAEVDDLLDACDALAFRAATDAAYNWRSAADRLTWQASCLLLPFEKVGVGAKAVEIQDLDL